MQIFYSSYQLKPKVSLNVRSGLSPRDGALIKVVEGDLFGVSDLFTWPEFGDDSWQEEIKNNSALYQRSLALAQLDLQARKEKRSLLFDKGVENNFLILDFIFSDDIKPTKTEKTFKIKGTYDYPALATFIEENEARFRIDFNSILSVDEFTDFLELLSKDALKKIEYIEDPTVWNKNDWSRWNKIVPLALDWSMLNPFLHPETWSTLVIKPTRQKAESLLKEALLLKKNITVTSSMGHPVGVMHDLSWIQNNLNCEGVHGLLTLEAYENTAFHSYFRQTDSILESSIDNLSDFGIGMTNQLSRLTWNEINAL